ncbi:hypothetical protein [Culicoidibacter larvae]|uniref:Flavodoxin n=1 Tax=Culicoidibacter larvae TaxID=2579976 RepID=A0A5R8QAI9_9FIRM|nr:hypothetical protein [Culicoidibacter larvae]TLG71766.1 hypothetical protein FEZ08_10180 [Culicoidibacter larvae]
MSNELVIYYSLNNHVRKIVADMPEPKVEITTVKKISKNKVWQMISLGFLVKSNKKLAINELDDIGLEQYDVIHFVTPIWAGKVALPLQAFLEKYPIKNKQVKLTMSCGGGVGESKEAFLKLLDDSNELVAFKVIAGQ